MNFFLKKKKKHNMNFIVQVYIIIMIARGFCSKGKCLWVQTSDHAYHISLCHKLYLQDIIFLISYIPLSWVVLTSHHFLNFAKYIIQTRTHKLDRCVLQPIGISIYTCFWWFQRYLERLENVGTSFLCCWKKRGI